MGVTSTVAKREVVRIIGATINTSDDVLDACRS